MKLSATLSHVFTLVLLFRGADAGSTEAVHQEEIRVLKHRRFNRAPSRKGSEAGKGPWRAVPVELKPNPVERRKYQQSSSAQTDTAGKPLVSPELLTWSSYVIAPESATPIPVGTTTPHTKSTDWTVPTDSTATTATEVADPRNQAGIMVARSLSPDETGVESVTETEGGEFGISADWRHALSMPVVDGKESSLRDEHCLVDEKQDNVHEILRRRDATPVGSKVWSDVKVAVCVRTKDFGRFLPEWIAYHYAIGVDEITIYDDDSVDKTKEVLQPFVDAGMVLYLFDEIGAMVNEMRPLNHCLKTYMARRENDATAPAWILFHDTDEYIFPLQTNLTISEALMEHSATCCVKVPRVQYGTGGHRQIPQGLTLETFLTHANPYKFADNRFPKVMVNLAPDDPSLGVVIPPLFNMHEASGCECDQIPVTEMRINHYLGNTEDNLARTKRAWEAGYSHEKVEIILETRDVNDETSDTITNWACATREVLYRIVEGIDLESGLE